MPYSIMKFKIPENIMDDCILTLNQINQRHIDETMRGSYQYAPVHVIVTKLKSEQTNQKMPTLLCRQNLEYISDEYKSVNALNIRLCRMKKGTYVVLYRYEWTTLHPERKAIISLYCPFKVELQKVKADSFGATDELLRIDMKNKKKKFSDEDDDGDEQMML